MVTPTRRVELAAHCVETFRRQRWPAKDLVLVVNRDSLDGAEAVAREIRDSDDMQIINVPEERYAGACLNVGHVLARGDYCFRMDDDDYYGDHYLMDMMLHLRAIDADVVGKPPRFCYFEAEGLACERQFKVPELTFLPADRMARNSLWLGGNTLGGRREALLRIRYGDFVYGAADTVFQMTAGDRGARIASLDELNMIASRREEAGAHTWSASVEELKKGARVLGPGVEHVMV
jgi:glycosyltransferase involved in cell wall biosynthesis